MGLNCCHPALVAPVALTSFREQKGERYMLIFINFMTSITPGIQYDYCHSKKGNLGIEVYIGKKRLSIRQEEKPGTNPSSQPSEGGANPAKTEILDS